MYFSAIDMKITLPSYKFFYFLDFLKILDFLDFWKFWIFLFDFLKLYSALKVGYECTI